MEVGGLAVLVEGCPQLVAQMMLGIVGDVLVFRRTNAVTLKILEQGATVLLVVHLPGLRPGHDLVRQHVVHHHADQAEQAETTPEPLVDPALNDGHVVFVLLKDELDHLKAQGHVACFV